MKENYIKEIIKMIEKAEDIEYLIACYTFIKYMKKEE